MWEIVLESTRKIARLFADNLGHLRFIGLTRIAFGL